MCVGIGISGLTKIVFQTDRSRAAMPVIEDRKSSVLVFSDIPISTAVLNTSQQVAFSIYKVYSDLSLDRLPDFIQRKVLIVIIIASIVNGETI